MYMAKTTVFSNLHLMFDPLPAYLNLGQNAALEFSNASHYCCSPRATTFSSTLKSSVNIHMPVL